MKRFGANKDMVMEDFGRQIRLFEQLAAKHKIDFFCPDYIKKETKVIKRNGIRYIIRPVSIFLLVPLYNSLRKLIKKEEYDIIIASSDPLIGIIGHYFSKKFKIPLAYDLQDNFEIYDTYKIPFVGYLDKQVIKNAHIVFTVSISLKEYISRLRKKPTYIIQNGVDLSLFRKANKKIARKKLGLPLNGKIIVYIGEISKLKGAPIMLDAFEKVKKRLPQTYLLLSGFVQKDLNIKRPNIIIKELPKRWDVVNALNASDVALLPNFDNSFSKYCFPYKVMEYMAVDLPIVATSISDMKMLFSKAKNSLCKPNDPEDMAKCIIANLNSKQTVSYKKDIKEYSWKNLAKKIEKAINSLKSRNNNLLS